MIVKLSDSLYSVDNQVHSFCSHDGRASINDQCARAVEIGLNEIGFTEHKDFDPFDPEVDYFDYDEYRAQIERARQLYGDVLDIRAGIEIDYQIWFEDKIASYLASHPFDFVLGSVHYIHRKMLMTDDYNRGRTRQIAYKDYFSAVKDSVKTGLFDVLAHLEYANRRGIAAWGPYDPAEFEDDLLGLFETTAQTPMALEINTAGLHQGLGITYPHPHTVRLFARAGGKRISIGSDSHHPDQLGHAYDYAANIAQDNGFSKVCTWHERALKEVPISS